MDVRKRRTARAYVPADVGTLWTMHRSEHVIRCALFAWAAEWELRIVMDGQILLAQRCQRGGAAFQLGDMWRDRMVKHGWQQVLPAHARMSPARARDARQDVCALDIQRG